MIVLVHIDNSDRLFYTSFILVKYTLEHKKPVQNLLLYYEVLEYTCRCNLHMSPGVSRD